MVPQSKRELDDTSFICVDLNVVSFNFGMQQEMLSSRTAWNKHAVNLARLLNKFGHGHIADFIFGCEVGGHGKGVQHAGVDLSNVVKEGLPSFKHETSGAYVALYEDMAELKGAGVYTPPAGRDVHMHWTMFQIRGASQLADSHDASQLVDDCVYVTVGNFHLRTPSTGQCPTMATRRSLTKVCLDHLANLGNEFGDGHAVVRILCGDVNMQKEGGLAATQDCRSPCSGKFSTNGKLCKWDCLSTEANRGGDIIFVSGAFAESYDVPVGFSYNDRGTRNDSHDAVAIHVSIPVRSMPRSATQPAASPRGASQPAAPPPATAGTGDSSSDVSDSSSSPEHPEPPEHSADYDPPEHPAHSTADEETASALHATLRSVEESEECPPDLQEQLGRLLFAKRIVLIDGRRRSYVVETGEVMQAIRTLLQRRKLFLDQMSLPANHQLVDAERQKIMSEWREEFHQLTEQVEQQFRDSWKPLSGASQPGAQQKGKGKGTGKYRRMPQKQGKPLPSSFGPNKKQWRAGMHSRFARHQQLVGGTKQIC